MDTVMVRTTAPHDNAFGTDYHKIVGMEYPCPVDAARSLERDGLVKIIPAEEPADELQTGGLLSTGSGNDGVGGDHGKERGAPGAKKGG